MQKRNNFFKEWKIETKINLNFDVYFKTKFLQFLVWFGLLRTENRSSKWILLKTFNFQKSSQLFQNTKFTLMLGEAIFSLHKDFKILLAFLTEKADGVSKMEWFC